MWSNLIPRNPSDHEDDEDVVGDGWDEDDLLEDEEEDDQEIVDIPTPAAVGGMFMGRLTRFIDQVTHAEDGEEEFDDEENDPSGDGWDDTDDVDLDLLDEDAAEDEMPVPDSQQQQQPFMSNSTTNPPPPPQSPANLTKPSSSTTQSPGGWAVSMMQQGLQAAAAAAAPRPLQEEEEDEDDLAEDTGDGWDQEDDDLDLSDDENMEASEEQPPPPSSSAMMNQSLNETVYMDAPQTPLQQQPTTNTTLDESHYVDTVEVSTPSADDAHPFSHLEDYESEVSQPLNTLLHEIREMDEKPATTPGQAVAPALIESNHELDEAPQSSTLSQPEPPVSETSNNTQSMEQQAQQY